MNLTPLINVDFPTRRRIHGFEGGAIYEAEENGKFFVIADESTLLDLLNEEDRAAFEPVTVHEFATAVDRRNFLIEHQWVTAMETEQQVFLDAQVFSMSLMATAQRNKHLYRSDASDEQKDIFRKVLRKELERLSKQYVADVTSLQHFTNIQGLADQMSTACHFVLEEGRLKVGAAQKVLNLYLKYMWCLGRIPAPPHCPFDSIVLSKIGRKGDRWTKEDGIEMYKTWVSLAEKAAAGTSLTEWELREFNKQFTLAP